MGRLIAAILACGLPFAFTALSATPTPPRRLFRGVPVTAPKIVAVYPHSTSSWTEGLVLADGVLYESTGCPSAVCNDHESRLLRVDLKTGVALQQVTLQNPFAFAEGITVLGDRIFQLTYASRRGYVYDRTSFELVSTYNFTTDTQQGWGLTSNSTHLIVSDGSNKLYFWNPALPGVAVGGVSFFDSAGTPISGLNELEYIGGPLQEVLVNMWIEDYFRVVRLSLLTGELIGLYDFSEVRGRILPDHDVFNGIAYDPDANELILTGKYYNATFVAALG